MNQFQIFGFDNQNIRVLKIESEPWFVATDVCKILELSNPSMVINRLDSDERSKFNLGRQGETNIVNESGLYELIFSSRKPSAKAFKKWVKSEVLTAIRKDGAYVHAAADDDDEIIMAKAVLAAQRAIERKDQLIAQQQQVIEQQKPQVIFAEAIQGASTSILVGDMAKILQQNGIKIGPNKLFEWLREKGYLIKRKGTDYNMPTQYSMQLGLFSIKETPVHRTSGVITISKTPKVTGKGQAYFINKFLTGVETA
ncbi:MAG: phage antirepressor [Lysinibacillus sp.]